MLIGVVNIAEYIREAVKAGSGKIWFADTASHGLVSLVPAKRRLLKVLRGRRYKLNIMTQIGRITPALF
jgi:hypothetical protein